MCVYSKQKEPHKNSTDTIKIIRTGKKSFVCQHLLHIEEMFLFCFVRYPYLASCRSAVIEENRETNTVTWEAIISILINVSLLNFGCLYMLVCDHAYNGVFIGNY